MVKTVFEAPEIGALGCPSSFRFCQAQDRSHIEQFLTGVIFFEWRQLRKIHCWSGAHNV